MKNKPELKLDSEGKCREAMNLVGALMYCKHAVLSMCDERDAYAMKAAVQLQTRLEDVSKHLHRYAFDIASLECHSMRSKPSLKNSIRSLRGTCKEVESALPTEMKAKLRSVSRELSAFARCT